MFENLKVKIKKNMAGFDLEELELAGELALKEHEENGSAPEDDDESESSEDESEEVFKSQAKATADEIQAVETRQKAAERELIINLETLRLADKSDSLSNTNDKPKIIELN